MPVGKPCCVAAVTELTVAVAAIVENGAAWRSIDDADAVYRVVERVGAALAFMLPHLARSRSHTLARAKDRFDPERTALWVSSPAAAGQREVSPSCPHLVP